MPTDKQRASVLSYWHSVEMFTPQAVPKVDPLVGVHNGQDLSGGWPWMSGHKATEGRLDPEQTWRHQVFCGLFDIQRITDHLTAVMHVKRETSEQRPPGRSAVASFFVGADGVALPGTLTISTCAWAIGRASRPGPDDSAWLTGFEEKRAAIEEAFLEYSGAMPAPAVDDDDLSSDHPGGPELAEPTTPPAQGRYLDTETMQEVLNLFSDRLGVADVLEPAGFRVRTRRVRRDSDAKPDDDFLNSFYLEDLILVRDAVLGGRLGPALRDYLTPPDAATVTERINVRERLDDVASRLGPETVPAGRWPESPALSLAASQQFAVSTLLAELSDREGIFAVNGPPGTGKTTMLRDLVAAVVTERAGRLAALTNAADAFTGEKHQFTSAYTRTVHEFRPELVGHEIVVASSNNGAVENISREIPGEKAVERWPDPPPYFRDLAQLVLDAQAALSKNAQPSTAWGLLAAPLGKSDNRRAFRTALMNGNAFVKAAPTPVTGLHDQFKQWEAGAGRPSWTAAKKAFQEARDQVEELRSRRSQHALNLAELGRVSEQSATAGRALAQAEADARSAAERAAGAAERLRQAKAVAEPLEAAWQARLQLKPGWWANAVSWGTKGSRWQEESTPIASQAEHARQAVADAAEVEGQSATDLVTTRATKQRAAATAAALSAEVARLQALVASVGSGFGVHDGAGWASRPVRDRELQAPWLDEELNDARTRLFLAALNVHEAWVANAGYKLRQNFLAATDALAGQIPRSGHTEALRGAWQTLFLIVPVVSTTFASVDRMFAGLGREDLGWLVVDEAGQATPQAAVGAIWRTRRSVIVGDPLQLKPVVTLGRVPQELLRVQNGVDERWMPSRSSLQTLADQLCRYGTYLPTAEEGPGRWVGAPLMVHRRCIDPMFRIANDMAYGGLMVSAAVEKDGPALFESGWRDVAGPAEGHWRPDQALAAIEMLKRLVTVDRVPPADIIVISPFHLVADRVGALIRRDRSLKGVRSGTVHTAQGKEAPVVLLLLGGDPQAPRAKTFAIEEPNLLNVAITRAQRRLYVVGQRDDWVELPYFENLGGLPVWRPSTGEHPNELD